MIDPVQSKPKHMNATTTKTSLRTLLSKRLSTLQSMVALSLVTVFAFGAVYAPLARADQFQEQINALQQQNNNTNANLDQLGAQAASLQDHINKLQNEINVLQAEIAANQAKRDDLQRQIVAAEEELAKQKKILGENIKAMYLEGQISTLEMLASSKDLSEFVDKQQYRDSVQDKIKATLDKINALKIQLKDQKQTIEGLLKDQENMRAQVAAQQAEQNRLLSLNQAEQNALNDKIKSNNSQIAELRAQQLIANRRLGGRVLAEGSCGGGYPARAINAYGGAWGCNYALDNTIDNWGMYNRECVSYTAWKVYQTYGYMPYWGGHGNANQWPASARADGIPTGSTPRAHSVAISMNGYYGHAMWVEAVQGNTIYVSQYNYSSPGNYSEMAISGSGLTYIYFN
jgi:peptidoglycan DL-endopeptidase CwlO